MSNNNSDDLVTDACPSPPRVNGEKHNQENLFGVPPEEPKQKFENKPNFHKKRAKKSSRTTNVINIQHAKGIHIGSNISVHYNTKAGTKPCENIPITPAIKKLFANNYRVNTHDLTSISTHMDSRHWQRTARALKYSDGQISQFIEDYRTSGIKEVIYKFLLDWMQYESSNATIGTLSQVLWDTEQQDVVQRWSKNFLE